MNSSSQIKGFTLLEVLLALAIFSFIAIATAHQITLIKNTKQSALSEVDQMNGVRTAISIMRNDLSQAFHIPYDTLGTQMKNEILQGVPVAHSLFDGRKHELVFTALSHRVYYAGLRECEQTEISYFLQDKKVSKYPTLMKRESEFIDSNLYEGGSIVSILDNVSDISFQYWDDKLERWVDDWNSDGANNRDKFPRAVKINVAAWDPKTQKEIKMQTSMKLAFPNNETELVKF